MNKKVHQGRQFKDGQPALRFGPGDLCGFTPTGLTGFQNLKPAAVIRELVQNSLDAAVEADEEVASLRFSLDTHPIDETPGIAQYRDAFNRAVKSQKKHAKGRLPDQAMAVVNSINSCLANNECEILTIEDNGVGLNGRRMRALLSDGISEKPEGATGAFGNGHVVSIPASDLRYVLYGGVLANGRKIASGHAILASHEGNAREPVRSKDGFFVKALHADNFREPYEFVTGNDIPALLADPLARIRDEWRHGSCVVIPAFNRFRLDGRNPIWNPISKAIAINFFAAIESGRLNATVIEGEHTRVLDRASLEQVLWENSDERRAPGHFLAGRDAYELYKTVRDGDRIEVGTGIGKVLMCWRLLDDAGRNRVGLCRNGMWVTKDIPGFHGKFSDRQPFQCVVLLDTKSAELHRLIRKAEGPLHNELSTKYLETDEKRALRKALDVIRETILATVPKVDATEYRPDDVLTVETMEEASVAQGGRKSSPRGIPTAVKTRPRRTSVTLPQSRKKRKTKKRANRGPAVPIEAVTIPTGRRACRISVIPKEPCARSEVRLILDENVDATCDEVDGETILIIEDVSIDGAPPAASAYVQNDTGETVGIKLGDLEVDQAKEIDLRYRIPATMKISSQEDIVSMVEVRQVSLPASSEDTSGR